MGYKEIRTYICDLCGVQETRTAENGLNYNWEEWMSTRIHAYIYHEPYKRDDFELEGLHCPKCVKNNDKKFLIMTSILGL